MGGVPASAPSQDIRFIQTQLTEYAGFCAANLAPSTVLVYRENLSYFFQWWTCSHSRLRFAPSLLHRYKTHLLAERERDGEALGARTVNSRLAEVRAFCDWLSIRELIRWDAREKIPDLRINANTYEPLPPEQVQSLMAPFDESLLSQRDAALCYLLVKTGIRAVQAHRADWGGSGRNV